MMRDLEWDWPLLPDELAGPETIRRWLGACEDPQGHCAFATLRIDGPAPAVDLCLGSLISREPAPALLLDARDALFSSVLLRCSSEHVGDPAWLEISWLLRIDVDYAWLPAMASVFQEISPGPIGTYSMQALLSLRCMHLQGHWSLDLDLAKERGWHAYAWRAVDHWGMSDQQEIQPHARLLHARQQLCATAAAYSGAPDLWPAVIRSRQDAQAAALAYEQRSEKARRADARKAAARIRRTEGAG